MTGGLDAMLGDIFDKLSALVDILSEITTGAKAFKKSIDDLTGGNGLLAIALTFILGLLVKKRKLIFSVTKHLKSFGGISRIVTSFLTGRMFTALIGISRGFGWVGLAISGVLLLLQQFGKAMQDRKLGKWTWIDTLEAKLENFKLRWELMTLDMQVNWINLKHALNPFWVSSGKKETFRYFGDLSAKKLSSPYVLSRNAGQQALKQQTQQAIKNAEASRGGGDKSPIPYASPNPFGKIPKITINSMTNVHIDKDGNTKRTEATADVMP